MCTYLFFFFKQKTAYEMRISDWSSTCALPIFDRREQHRAAGAAFTEQRPLRALQHLYTGQVIDLKILDCRIYVLADTAKRNVVEIGHNAGIAAKGVALPAQAVIRRFPGAAAAPHIQARCVEGQIVDREGVVEGKRGTVS